MNPYNYETEEEIEEHLGLDLVDMVICLERYGYVVQEQFKKLDVYLCENYASTIMNILDKRMINTNILYGFSKRNCCFVFYDTNRYQMDEAVAKADIFFDKLYR